MLELSECKYKETFFFLVVITLLSRILSEMVEKKRDSDCPKKYNRKPLSLNKFLLFSKQHSMVQCEIRKLLEMNFQRTGPDCINCVICVCVL